MKTKSPIKQKPLSNPAESLDLKILNLFLDDFIPYYFAAACLVLVAILEWSVQPSPMFYAGIAGCMVAVSGWKTYTVLKKIKRLKLGRDGEKIVGQYLDQLMRKGAYVFHDLIGEGFNLDHVIVHHTGIYVVETKTYSKPVKGKSIILYDGSSLRKNGVRLNPNPLIQVRAAKSWLNEKIKESTGREFPIQGILAFPGWYIENTSKGRADGTWVLNPKAIPKFIGNSDSKLSQEDVNLCASHLRLYIRHKNEHK